MYHLARANLVTRAICVLLLAKPIASALLNLKMRFDARLVHDLWNNLLKRELISVNEGHAVAASAPLIGTLVANEHVGALENLRIVSVRYAVLLSPLAQEQLAIGVHGRSVNYDGLPELLQCHENVRGNANSNSARVYRAIPIEDHNLWEIGGAPDSHASPVLQIGNHSRERHLAVVLRVKLVVLLTSSKGYRSGYLRPFFWLNSNPLPTRMTHRNGLAAVGVVDVILGQITAHTAIPTRRSGGFLDGLFQDLRKRNLLVAYRVRVAGFIRPEFWHLSDLARSGGVGLPENPSSISNA